MTVRMYTIYDRVAEEAGPIFSAVNDGVALRNYRQIIKDTPAVDAEEFKLYFLGEFETSAMKINLQVMPVEVINFYNAEIGKAVN